VALSRYWTPATGTCQAYIGLMLLCVIRLPASHKAVAAVRKRP